MADKKALITGITGQDRYYLADFLLDKGYEVHGIIRRSSSFNRQRLEHLYIIPESRVQNYSFTTVTFQILKRFPILYTISVRMKCSNLGAQSHVRVSFDMPEYTTNVTALGVTRLLEIVRRSNHKVRIYQASSSEMFGSASPLREKTHPFVQEVRMPVQNCMLIG